MRTKDSQEQIDYLRQASEADSLDQIFTGLDVLGSTPWSINRTVFDIASEVWNSGEALADIPVKDALLDTTEPEKPENYDTDPRAKDTFRHRVKKAILEKRAAHSNRCDVNYKLEIARAVSFFISLLLTRTDAVYDDSSSARHSSFPTTSISEVERTRFRQISRISETISVEEFCNSEKRNRSECEVYDGSRFISPT